MATVSGLTAAKINALLAERVAAASQAVPTTAAALVAAASVTGTIPLGKAFRLDKLVVNKACRLRLYSSGAQRTADADRDRSTDPVGDHGCFAEFIMTPLLLSLTIIPAIHGYCPDGLAYFSLTNDGTTGDLTFTLTEQILEP